MNTITTAPAATDAPAKRKPSMPSARGLANGRAAAAAATENADGVSAVAPPPVTAAESKPERISRTDQLIAQLRTPHGAAIEDMCSRFGWLPHSARAALTGLRKRGLDVERSKAGTVAVYRIAAA
jgi:hypothetical protein